MKRLLWLVPLGVVLLLLAAFVWKISESGTADTDAVEAALVKDAARLSGIGDAKALAAATCSAADEDGEYDCIPNGASARQAVRIVRKDGVLTKRFSGRQPTRKLRTAAQVAEALPIDAVARGRAVGRFSCATSLRTTPDGSVEQGTASGLLCVEAERPQAGSRYVEPAPDGTIARDYQVRSPATP